MKLLREFNIERKKVSREGSAYIIAEIGVNHNGSESNCKKLLYAAWKSGADAAKLQIANPQLSYGRNHPSFKEFKNKFLSDQSLKKLQKYSKSLGISLFATPGDFESLERICKIKMPAIKISSGLLTNLPSIMEASKKNVPIILSTGMSYFKEILEAVNISKKYQNKIIILKCTSIYPAPAETLNLKGISTLKKRFNIPIGYSDHCLGIDSAVNAVALGATIIEKHFTLNKSLKGADHKISLEPTEFKEMVKKIRLIEQMRGKSNIAPTKIEEKNRKRSYRKIVTFKKILIGEKFSKKNIVFKRMVSSKQGFKPEYFFKINGKKAKKNFSSDHILTFNDLK